MKAETQFTAILLMCGSPPPDNKRPNGFREIEYQHEPKLAWQPAENWRKWAVTARRCAVDNGFIYQIGEWSEFLDVFLRWYDDQVTHCVTSKRRVANVKQ